MKGYHITNKMKHLRTLKQIAAYNLTKYILQFLLNVPPKNFAQPQYQWMFSETSLTIDKPCNSCYYIDQLVRRFKVNIISLDSTLDCKHTDSLCLWSWSIVYFCGVKLSDDPYTYRKYPTCCKVSKSDSTLHHDVKICGCFQNFQNIGRS